MQIMFVLVQIGILGKRKVTFFILGLFMEPLEMSSLLSCMITILEKN